MRMVLDSGNIVEIEHEGLRVPLRVPIPIAKYEEFRKEVERALGHLDLTQIIPVGQQRESEVSEWDDDEVASFLNKATEYQRAFFQPLAERGDSWMTTEELLPGVSSLVKEPVGSQSLGAVRGQLRRKYNRMGRKSLENAEWDDRRGQMRYRLRVRNLEAVRRFFGIS